MSSRAAWLSSSEPVNNCDLIVMPRTRHRRALGGLGQGLGRAEHPGHDLACDRDTTLRAGGCCTEEAAGAEPVEDTHLLNPQGERPPRRQPGGHSLVVTLTYSPVTRKSHACVWFQTSLLRGNLKAIKELRQPTAASVTIGQMNVAAAQSNTAVVPPTPSTQESSRDGQNGGRHVVK